MVTLVENRVNCGNPSYKYMLKPITNYQQLVDFLSQQNSYCVFINSLLQKNQQLKHVAYKTETHHIIPYHAGGIDNKFNRILLTYDQHLEAHKLLFEVYGLLADQYVINMRYKNNEQSSYLRIKLSHQRCKKNQTGFYNTNQQKASGLKGGRVKSKTKDVCFEKKLCAQCRHLLTTNHSWVYKKTGYKVDIKANQFFLMRDLAKKLIDYDICFAKCKNTNLQYIAGNFAKVVKKTRKSAYGWELILDN